MISSPPAVTYWQRGRFAVGSGRLRISLKIEKLGVAGAIPFNLIVASDRRSCTNLTHNFAKTQRGSRSYAGIVDLIDMVTSEYDWNSHEEEIYLLHLQIAKLKVCMCRCRQWHNAPEYATRALQKICQKVNI